MRKILLLLLVTVIGIQLTGCNAMTKEPALFPPEDTPTPDPYCNESFQVIENIPEQTTTPTINDDMLSNDTSMLSAEGNEIIVHNANELLYYLDSNKHFKLEPGGSYDLYDSLIKSGGRGVGGTGV